LNFSARRLAVCVTLFAGFAQAMSAAEILISDAKSQPESLTIAPGGILFVGSASTPFVYKVRPGSTTAEKFVDASAEGAGTFFFGMLADAATNTLWACQLTPVPGTAPVQRHTALRGFDLSTGAEKLRWNLPGDNSTCNDFAIGPDKALYISDTANSKIYKLPARASTAELFLEDRALRSRMDAAGNAAQPVDIWMDQPIKGPDGMRAANGKLLVAENGIVKISVITVNGDKASVTVIKEGLKTPTAVEPAGDTIWIAERGAGKAVSIPMPR